MIFFIEHKLKTRDIKQIKTTINTACTRMRKKERAALFVCLFDQVEGKDRLILYKWIYCVMWAIKLIKGSTAVGGEWGHEFFSATTSP